jgi:leucyl-tRNA synthetase
MGVQVNGKLRASISVDSNSSEDEVRLQTLALPEVHKWLEGKTPKKVIIVLGKIVNIVV